jgi:hypothetical protein
VSICPSVLRLHPKDDSQCLGSLLAGGVLLASPGFWFHRAACHSNADRGAVSFTLKCVGQSRSPTIIMHDVGYS